MFTRNFANGLTTGILLGAILGLALAQARQGEPLADMGRRLGELADDVADRGRRFVGRATETLDDLIEM